MTVKTFFRRDDRLRSPAAKNPARQRSLRLGVVALIAVTALLYFLIGFGVLRVLENPNDQQVFGLIAGGGYVLAVLAVLLIERRWLYITGALLQTFIIFQYFNLAPERVPTFEVWGLLLRVPQGLLLAALVLLVFVTPKRQAI